MAVAEFPTAAAADMRAPAVAAAAITPVRAYFAVLSLLSLSAFVFGVENRFSAENLLPVSPPVDWIPPLSASVWSEAFTIHLQDPLFAACGSAVSLEQFKIMYWWEWLRQASLSAVAIGATIGFYGASVWPRYRFALPRLVGLAGLVVVYWAARTSAEVALTAVPALSSFNVGQYRHAIDVTFASVLVAAVLASAASPPRPAAAVLVRRTDRSEWLWIVVILADICFGALFAARNATASWPTWPGYEGQPFPPLGHLVSYAPWWLNFTFNPYMIQLVHRVLSAALWIAALWQLGAAMLCSRRSTRALARFVLISAQTFTGIATLVFAVPAVLSLVHQVGAICLLAASLVFLPVRR
jgi:cytochrome c oxidase assembly protein subunit 15